MKTERKKPKIKTHMKGGVFATREYGAAVKKLRQSAGIVLDKREEAIFAAGYCEGCLVELERNSLARELARRSLGVKEK